MRYEVGAEVRLHQLLPAHTSKGRTSTKALRRKYAVLRAFLNRASPDDGCCTAEDGVRVPPRLHSENSTANCRMRGNSPSLPSIRRQPQQPKGCSSTESVNKGEGSIYRHQKMAGGSGSVPGQQGNAATCSCGRTRKDVEKLNKAIAERDGHGLRCGNLSSVSTSTVGWTHLRHCTRRGA